jgi:hypothetical protein
MGAREGTRVNLYQQLLGEHEAGDLEASHQIAEETKAALLTKATTDAIVQSERPAMLVGLGMVLLALAIHRSRETDEDGGVDVEDERTVNVGRDRGYGFRG